MGKSQQELKKSDLFKKGYGSYVDIVQGRNLQASSMIDKRNQHASMTNYGNQKASMIKYGNKNASMSNYGNQNASMI